MSAPKTGSSPSQREVRHHVVDDLEASTFNLQEDSSTLTQTGEAGQSAQVASNQHDRSTLAANQNPLGDPKLLDHPSLSTPDHNSSTTVLIHQSPHQVDQVKRLREQRRKYAQHMAEAALTRNGRALKAKATTKVASTTAHSYTSAYTRPCAELWREVVERRYPPGVNYRRP